MSVNAWIVLILGGLQAGIAALLASDMEVGQVEAAGLVVLASAIGFILNQMRAIGESGVDHDPDVGH